MTDIVELMGQVITGSGSDVNPAQAIAFLSRHIIDHDSSTCACGPNRVDPLEHLAEVAMLAMQIPEPREPRTPVQWRHRSRALGGYLGGPTNRIDQLLDIEYSDAQIASMLFVPRRIVARRRREWEQINQHIEEAAA